MEKPGVNEMGEPEAPAPRGAADVYFLFVAASNLVTALVPSETACLASSPGMAQRPSRRRGAQSQGIKVELPIVPSPLRSPFRDQLRRLAAPLAIP